VAAATLLPISCLPFELYIQPQPSKPALLYRARRVPFHQADVETLIENGVKILYISAEDHEAYQDYLHREVIQNRQVEPARRFSLLKDATRSIFEHFSRTNDTGRLVRVASGFGEQVTNIILSEDLVLHDLFSLLDHDYYTYTHAVNVCTYCAVVAGRLGITGKQELNAVAAGGLLHDLGKREIGTQILNKRGRLGGQEYRLVQEHPLIGFKDLCCRTDVTWGQLMMIYQHHERLDGSGYPVQLAGDGVHLWARICAVVDVFDALTNVRPYRTRDSAGDALNFLAQRAPEQFDEEVVRCLAEVVPCPA
jgi:HD-GYP domain-containing protein (c-di-GMP phosphodiesterase class II)